MALAKALQLLEAMAHSSCPPGREAFTSALRALRTRWQVSLALWAEMRRSCEADVVAAGALLASVASLVATAPLEKLLQVLQEMTSEILRPDAVSLAACLDACERRAHARSGRELMRRLEGEGG
ncbi:unnamed protein product [Effrenium voratum]|nr:unnamed protein product [Effrenium voratum]